MRASVRRQRLCEMCIRDRRLPTKMVLSEEAYEAGGRLAIGQLGGFTARIREEALPAGEYSVYIAYRTDGHDILADTGRKVQVGA